MKLVLSLVLASVFFAAGCAKQSDSVINKNLSAQNAIINGKAALETDAITASTVSLMIRWDGELYSICSGTLISEDLILTAGHCLMAVDDPKDLMIFFGPVLPKNISDSRLLAVESAKANPNFEPSEDEDADPATRLNDIGVIKLKAKAPAGTVAVPVLSPESELKAQQSLLLAGYGMVIEKPRTSAKGLNYTTVPLAEITDETILVTDQKVSGACSGDSGGPAYVQTPNGLAVVGATRGPKEPAVDCHHFGEYTYASKFKDFILESAKLLGAKAPTFVDIK